MARAALIRLLFVIVAAAPVVRATCDVSCIRMPEPAPPPCHSHDAGSGERPDGCAHDHSQIVARVSSPPAFDAAILPAIVIPAIVPLPVTTPTVSKDGTRLSRGSPPAVLRI